MNEQHFILATAGHVDHGKSALVRALTGIDPDRLPEEKARGITIELGFAHLALASPDDPGAVFRLGIVDVPGHEDFVKNMVAGVGSIDLALLTVAADDGWMPQTEEHLQILAYLGVQRAVIALTKIDLAKSEAETESAIRAQLAGSPFRDAPIVRTSIPAARGLDELQTQLARELHSLTPQPDAGKPRLAVDRAFTLRGIGTVVTGTLAGGAFRRGQEVIVQPAGLPARIRSIQSHNREVEAIGPGARVALNIPDVSVARDNHASGIARGDVVTLADLGPASTAIDAVLTRSPRLPAKTRPLKEGTAVRVHHGSANFEARVFFQDRDSLGAGETAGAQLRFSRPAFVFAGDRFVVRDSSEQGTLAGGIVLDPDAAPKDFRSPAQRKFLAGRMQSPESAEVFVRTQVERDCVLRASQVLTKSRFSRSEIAAAIAQLTAAQNAVARGEMILDAKWWAELQGRARAVIEQEHKTHSNRVGLELTQLRKALGRELPLPELFDLLVAELTATGFVRDGEKIRRADHQPALPGPLQAAGARIRAALSAKPFDPPSRKELAPDPIARQALRFFCDTGEAVEISDEIILSRDALAKMREAIARHLRAHGPASVSDLRHALGSTRRVMVPLLEHLDRQGLTRRLGDQRALRE